MLLRPRQKIFVEKSVAALKEHGNTLGVAPTGCHAPGAPILMFDGTVKKVEEVQTGDLLMGPDSTSRTVLELHHGQDEMYEIRPIKGTSFVVNGGHILSLVKTNEGIKGSHAWSSPSGTITNISVNSYIQTSHNFKHLHKLYRAKVDFMESGLLPLDPYFFGLLLGDGGLAHGTPNITTPDPEIITYCQHTADSLGLTLRIDQLNDNEANTYFFVKGKNRKNPLTEILRTLAIYGKKSSEKFLPQLYKTSSSKERASLLAGLLDTDGHLQSNIIEYSTASYQLAQDVAFISRSLGFMALPKEKIVNGVIYYRFCICGDFTNIPLRVSRKIPGERRQKKNPLRTGFTVHQMGKGEYYGFTVDSDNLYVMGDFTVTHNSGKTIMLSGVIGELLKDNSRKACVLAHRDELTAQNCQKFNKVSPTLTTSIFDAANKSFCGDVTFAMVQTLSRDNSINLMPELDLLVIDEAHHAIANGYMRIIDKIKELNPECMVYGVTATPMRGDKKGLRPIFSNVSDQITLEELIASGHLVPPRTFVVDVGVREELTNVKKVAADFDMGEVDKIMNKRPITNAVVKHWKEKAGDRKTIVFCSTVDHARNVCQTFTDEGVTAVLIHGGLSKSDREAALKSYEEGDTQVIVNIAVLTEGYDYTPTSCVVLLRPSSYRSTMIQMVGRGLRTIDPAEYPGIIKTDCIILDFGTSSLMHGSLEQSVTLDVKETDSEAPKKDCPECNAVVPMSVRECSLCGYVWEQKESEETEDDRLSDFIMSEIDLLARSSFKWCDIFSDDAALIAQGFNAWAGIFFLEGRWHSVGGGKDLKTSLLSIGERTVCLAAADDWLNDNETSDSAHKTNQWLNQPATYKQLRYLPTHLKNDHGLTRYQASALLTFQFNKKNIRNLVFNSRRAA